MDFTEKLRLREKAIEDLYLAKVDRKLIEALYEKQNQQELPVTSESMDISPFQTIHRTSHPGISILPVLLRSVSGTSTIPL